MSHCIRLSIVRDVRDCTTEVDVFAVRSLIESATVLS
jgi:hypothetical protein